MLVNDLAGFSEYRDARGRRTFMHTEIDLAFEARGLGSKLAAAALDDVRAKGKQVVPICPFIKSFIDRHPEYADLIPA
jgi:predicted GNAT family acetyltransferase